MTGRGGVRARCPSAFFSDWSGGSRGRGPLSKRIKHVGVVILAQAACLSVGLWVQQQYVCSSASRAAIEAALDELRWSADAATSYLQTQNPSAVASQPGQETLSQRLTDLRPPSGHLMLIDSRSRVMQTSFDVSGKQPHPLARGIQVSWTSLQRGFDDPTTKGRPMLDMPDGPHLAVKRKLREYGGSVVAHRSRADVESGAAGLLGSLSAISALTLLWTCALLATTAYMVLAKLHDEADKERRRSDAEALRQRQRLVRSRNAIIFGLAKLAESRDPETGDHLDRIAVYSTTLAAALRRNSKYKNQITLGFVSRIEISSALHDIGKVGIEDRILRKPGSLTEEERSLMQTHSTIGGVCLRGIELRLGSSNFLQMAREIAFSHHERWDGTGYPEGLKGTQIPLAARIVAIADVYDALSTKRVYKEAYSHDRCVATIRQGAGTQFDPDLVEAWLAVEARFSEIARHYKDDAKAPEVAEPTSGELSEAAGESKPAPELEVVASFVAGAEE